MSATTAVEERYCDQCGSLLPAVARFCGLCGAPAADLAGSPGAVHRVARPVLLPTKIGLVLAVATGLIAILIKSVDSYLGATLPAGRLALAGAGIMAVGALGLTTGRIPLGFSMGMVSSAALLWIVQSADLSVTGEPTLSVLLLGVGGVIAILSVAAVPPLFRRFRKGLGGATPNPVAEPEAEATRDEPPSETLGPPPISSPRSTVIREPDQDTEQVDPTKVGLTEEDEGKGET